MAWTLKAEVNFFIEQFLKIFQLSCCFYFPIRGFWGSLIHIFVSNQYEIKITWNAYKFFQDRGVSGN